MVKWLKRYIVTSGKPLRQALNGRGNTGYEIHDCNQGDTFSLWVDQAGPCSINRPRSGRSTIIDRALPARRTPVAPGPHLPLTLASPLRLFARSVCRLAIAAGTAASEFPDEILQRLGASGRFLQVDPRFLAQDQAEQSLEDVAASRALAFTRSCSRHC